MAKIIDRILAEYEVDFQGWDFSYLSDAGRMIESVLPWNYQQIIEKYYISKNVLLDMGTGGGELLTSLKNLPSKVYATEGYLPNLKVAEKRLKSINAGVKFIKEDNIIPYDDQMFDIVINRHEEFKAAEVKRVLDKNGIFITQQVGGVNDINLNLSLNTKPSIYLSWNLFSATEELEGSGFSILKGQESYGYTRFFDVGAIVYYLKCIPWQIEDFSVEKYQEQLIRLHNYIDTNGFFDLINHRFLIIAQRDTMFKSEANSAP